MKNNLEDFNENKINWFWLIVSTLGAILTTISVLLFALGN